MSGVLGYGRDYRQYPYNNYEAINNPETLLPHEEFDNRRPPKERVLAFSREHGFGMAFPFSVLESMGDRVAVHDDIQGTQSVVVFWSTEAESAVAYKSDANGQALTFEIREGKFVDVETESEWTLTGRAIAGPLEGSALELAPDAYVAFWFAWTTFHPNTDLLPGPRDGPVDSGDRGDQLLVMRNRQL